MKSGEREELQRQGAKAAARGEAARCNPLLDACHDPTATGEGLDHWEQRVGAWQSGFDAQNVQARTPVDHRASAEDEGEDLAGEPHA